MSSETNVTVHVGTLAEVKVGRNQVLVVVTSVTPFGWMVKSISSGREFQVSRIDKVFPSDATEKQETTDSEENNSGQDSPEPERPAQNSETTTTEPERTAPDMESETTITEPAEVVEQTTEMAESATTITEPTAAAEQATATTETATEPTEAAVPTPAPRPTKKMSLMDAAVEVLKVSGQPMNTREMVKAATDQGLWIPTGCKTPEQTLYGSIFREIATKDSPRIVKAEQKGKFRLG